MARGARQPRRPVRPPLEWRGVFTLEDAVGIALPGQDTTVAARSLRREGRRAADKARFRHDRRALF